MLAELGKIGISEENIFNSEMPFKKEVFKLADGIEYVRNSILVLDGETKRFYPYYSGIEPGFSVILLDFDDVGNAVCGVFGSVKKEMVCKADDENYSGYSLIDDDDYLFLLQNSKLM